MLLGIEGWSNKNRLEVKGVKPNRVSRGQDELDSTTEVDFQSQGQNNLLAFILNVFLNRRKLRLPWSKLTRDSSIKQLLYSAVRFLSFRRNLYFILCIRFIPVKQPYSIFRLNLPASLRESNIKAQTQLPVERSVAFPRCDPRRSGRPTALGVWA